MLETQQNAAKAKSTSWMSAGLRQFSLNNRPAKTKTFLSHWCGRINLKRPDMGNIDERLRGGQR
jgi:hypothetical protein